MHVMRKYNIKPQRICFFFTHAITILSLFTYSVCDEKVKICINQLKLSRGRGESAALGRRMPWPNRLFSKKYERKNLEFFT